MLSPDDFLQPISTDRPSGEDLRYERVYDDARNAMKEEEAITDGDLRRPEKRADVDFVLRTVSEVLKKQTKDLRFLEFFLEASVRKEGTVNLAPSLLLLRRMAGDFWLTLYPEIEEGNDVEMRKVAIEAATSRIAAALPQIKTTASGYTQRDYFEAKIAGYEGEETDDEEKQRARARLSTLKRPMMEDWDRSVERTSKQFFADAIKAVEAAQAELKLLEAFGDDKFGKASPNLNKLGTALDDYRRFLVNILDAKGGPDESTEAVTASAEEPVAEEAAPSAPAAVNAPRRAAVKAKAGADPLSTIVANALAIYEENTDSPVAYLVCSSLRLGETRMHSSSPETGFAVGPDSDLRKKLRDLLSNGAWKDLMVAALTAMGEPCGRAWLDLHRYAWRAADQMGCPVVAEAVVHTVRSVLASQPNLRHWTLEDDTSAANPETQQWIDSEVIVAETQAQPEQHQEEQPTEVSLEDVPAVSDEEPALSASLYEEALAKMRSGAAAEGVAMLARDADSQPSGRMRFRRRVQVAQLCVAAGYKDVGLSMLRDLSEEMERRNLEGWEGQDLLVPPLALMLQCLNGKGDDRAMREAAFARLCRLDPPTALNLRQ